MDLPSLPRKYLMNGYDFVAKLPDVRGRVRGVGLAVKNEKEIDVVNFGDVRAVMAQIVDNVRILLFSNRLLRLYGQWSQRSDDECCTGHKMK